ncbi:MAG TPA: glycosyltransferase [bacterium]|nr:glycosyltransferase [bacterium]
MHVGLFTDSYLPRTSGVVTAVETSARQLRARGHRVSIVAPAYPGHADADPDVVRVPSITPPGHPDFPLALPYPGRALRAVRALGLDLVHTHSPFLLGGIGWWAARSLGRPVLFTYHTRYDEYAHYAPVVGEFARPLLGAYATAYCNQCDCVLAPLPSVAALLRDSGVRVRVAVVPSAGIDIAAFASPAGRDVRTAVRGRFGVPPRAPLLVYVGRLAREKNVALLLAALAALPPDTWLLLAGDGPERPALQAQAKDVGLASRTIFAGTQPPAAVAEVLAAADLFVFPSMTETFGLAMIEAMAAGCAVVAVRAAASSDLLRDGETGRLVPGDPMTFADAVRDLLAQPARRSAMGGAARAAAADYDQARVTDRLLIVYQELLAHHTPMIRGGLTCV